MPFLHHRRSNIYFIVLSFFVVITEALLYPTRPIANSVFHGGCFNKVTWINSDSRPSLFDMGRMRMDLYVNDNELLARLSTDVDPREMSKSVFIPPSLWGNASNFHIRFESEHPSLTIYTADFTIIDMSGKNTNSLDKASTVSLSDGFTTSPSLMDAERGSAAASNFEMVTVTMETTSSGDSLPFPTNGAISSNDSPTGLRGSRKHTSWFKFIFVLWPALFGLALAL